MALFVDGPACTIEDLTDHDAGVMAVAQDESIDLATKLRLAQEEIGMELQQWLDRARPAANVPWVPSLRIEQIVVTPTLRRWQIMLALVLVYRDAYFSQLVDRYQAKWQEYVGLSRTAKENFIASGLALVNNPVPQAGAPILNTAPGPQAGGTFYAAVAWVNASGQEGAASAAASLTVLAGRAMTVQSKTPPPNVKGWNVYAGASPDLMVRQNNARLAANDTWTYVPGSVTQAARPGSGQQVEFTRPLARTWLRG